MRADHFDHIVLVVRDLDVTTDFYTRVLGMESVTFGGGRRALVFGSSKINLHQAGREFEPGAHRPTPGSTDVCLIVNQPIDDVVTELGRLGVDIEEGPLRRTGASGPITSVYVRDPDANLVEISTYWGMGTVEKRIAALGLRLPEVVPPLATYQPAVRSGPYVVTSGQLPMVDGVMPVTGKVGTEVGAEQAKELAAVSALNALAAVKSVVGDLDRIVRVVKVVGFVASTPDFTGQPGVVDGASELLGDVLGDKGVHARSAVGVAVLPLDAPVEIEIQVEVRDQEPSNGSPPCPSRR
ncbi:enamine deaminase RidA (YjgF/YER057c/UK114 family) [Streptomyces aurantiacus]|nr:enamine deaminase RidA (YjgF/YER057c/UK114 family) [Streptomyces aurantiacus]